MSRPAHSHHCSQRRRNAPDRHRSTPPEPIQTPPQYPPPGWLERWLCLGLLWALVGMAVMPAGPSFDPSRLFQDSLGLLLYLPALILTVRERARLRQALAGQPLAWAMAALLLWANLTLIWSSADGLRSEMWKAITIGLFVLGWQLATGQRPSLAQTLLRRAALAIGVSAWAYSLHFLLNPRLPGERIAGLGVIGTPNYAAALMAAAALCLLSLPAERRAERVGAWLALAGCLLFTGLSQSRSVWLALAICAICTPLLRPGLPSRLAALGVWLTAAAAAALPLPILYERGSSRRVELLDGALRIVHQHPFGGLGQGAEFMILVDGESYPHTHNVLTQALVQLGLPGMLLLCLMWALAGWVGWCHRRKRLGRLLALLWIFSTVALQFDMPQLIDSPRPGWMLIWLPIALALGLEARAAGAPGRRAGSATAAGICPRSH